MILCIRLDIFNSINLPVSQVNQTLKSNTWKSLGKHISQQQQSSNWLYLYKGQGHQVNETVSFIAEHLVLYLVFLPQIDRHTKFADNINKK